jgi:diguanylate cyclase (GGDEF)-like protein
MHMVAALFHKVIQPQSTDEDDAYREQMVRIVLIMIIIVLLPMNLVVVTLRLTGAFTNQPLYMTLGMDVGIAICCFLVTRGQWRPAGQLTAFCFFLLAASGSYLNGHNTAVVLTYAIVVLLVSMFSGGKGSWLAVIVSTLTHGILGIFHDSNPAGSMLVSSVVTAFALTGIALLQNLATRLLRTALAEERSVKEEMSKEIEERKQLELQLQFWGMHDAMTGLYNRFYFEAELERLQVSRQHPISIMMADLDSLKHINDHYGHAFGDLLLKSAAKVLKDTFRAEDVVARIGGDEFAVLLIQTDEVTIQKIAARLSKNLDEHNSLFPDQIIELSVGVATSDTAMPLTQVLKLADDRMYAEKWGKKLETSLDSIASKVASGH